MGPNFNSVAIKNQTKALYKFGLVTEAAWWMIFLNPLGRASWMKDAIDPRRREACFPQRLLPYIEKFRKEGRIARVIDVGSGPLSPLAWGVDQKLIDLVAVDPLASVYHLLMKTYRIKFPVKPIGCLAENLLHLFEPESFDIVYSRNALDHVQDAELCIKNICNVLKKDGLFYFQGFTREGSRQSWRGLHKHDFIIDHGDLIWSNREGEVKNLSDIVGLKCAYQNKENYSIGEWFIGEFKKANS